MVEWFTETAGTGSMALAIPVAVIAGLVSFFTPCVIPMLPGYLSYASGISGADLATGQGRRSRLVAGAALFVLGFSVVFVSLGLASGQVVAWFFVNGRTFNIVLGALCVVLGVAFLGGIRWLQRDIRFHKVPAVGLAAAPLLGALFGIGWIPCTGPTLAVILNLGAYEGTAGRSGLLLGFYSLGLGVPFVVVALAWRRATVALAFVRRHQQWVTRFGGVMLIAIGVLLLSGLWDYAVQWLQVHLVSQYQPEI